MAVDLLRARAAAGPAKKAPARKAGGVKKAAKTTKAAKPTKKKA
jgi:hypothetical protein